MDGVSVRLLNAGALSDLTEICGAFLVGVIIWTMAVSRDCLFSSVNKVAVIKLENISAHTRIF